MSVTSFSNIRAQEDEKKKQTMNFPVEYTRQAQYSDGEELLFRYLYDNISFTEVALLQQLNGTVTVSFDVLPDSTLSNFVILSSPGMGVDSEIIRLLSPLKFLPAVAGGQAVKQNVILSIPIRAPSMTR